MVPCVPAAEEDRGMQPACLGAVQRAAGMGSGLSWSDGGDRVITPRGDRGDVGVPCATVRRRNGNRRERDSRGQCPPLGPPWLYKEVSSHSTHFSMRGSKSPNEASLPSGSGCGWQMPTRHAGCARQSSLLLQTVWQTQPPAVGSAVPRSHLDALPACPSGTHSDKGASSCDSDLQH